MWVYVAIILKKLTKTSNGFLTANNITYVSYLESIGVLKGKCVLFIQHLSFTIPSPLNPEYYNEIFKENFIN